MITLTSDFGSPYPAAMKGVIRRQTRAELIDIAHDLPRGDPRAAAFWLRFVLPEFPPAVHCAVIDPGVGTDRDAIVVHAGDHAIVAPDNGLALPPARALAEDQPIEVFEITADDPASATFHGRDVFAPAAARIHESAWAETGVDRDALAACPSVTPTNEYVDHRFPKPTVDRDADGAGVVSGEILVVDDFGNAITNVPGDAVAAADPGDRVRVNGGDPVPFVETFASVPPGDRLVTVGSHGHVECDVNDGRGTDAFGVDVGDPVRLSFER